MKKKIRTTGREITRYFSGDIVSKDNLPPIETLRPYDDKTKEFLSQLTDKEIEMSYYDYNDLRFMTLLKSFATPYYEYAILNYEEIYEKVRHYLHLRKFQIKEIPIEGSQYKNMQILIPIINGNIEYAIKILSRYHYELVDMRLKNIPEGYWALGEFGMEEKYKTYRSYREKSVDKREIPKMNIDNIGYCNEEVESIMKGLNDKSLIEKAYRLYKNCFHSNSSLLIDYVMDDDSLEIRNAVNGLIRKFPLSEWQVRVKVIDGVRKNLEIIIPNVGTNLTLFDKTMAENQYRRVNPKRGDFKRNAWIMVEYRPFLRRRLTYTLTTNNEVCPGLVELERRLALPKNVPEWEQRIYAAPSGDLRQDDFSKVIKKRDDDEYAELTKLIRKYKKNDTPQIHWGYNEYAVAFMRFVFILEEWQIIRCRESKIVSFIIPTLKDNIRILKYAMAICGYSPNGEIEKSYNDEWCKIDFIPSGEMPNSIISKSPDRRLFYDYL